jgi:hypothetical protein
MNNESLNEYQQSIIHSHSLSFPSINHSFSRSTLLVINACSAPATTWGQASAPIDALAINGDYHRRRGFYLLCCIHTDFSDCWSKICMKFNKWDAHQR